MSVILGKLSAMGLPLFKNRPLDELIHLSREGLDAASFEEIVARLPFSLQEWARFLGVSERTLIRVRKENKALGTPASDKVIRITQLYQKGIDVFRDEDKFCYWLEARIMAVGGVAPKSLLDTSFGLELVDTTLGQIEFGIFA
jgi:putative toxin-antitoxin system antitoxin component (TIGR02293 family)